MIHSRGIDSSWARLRREHRVSQSEGNMVNVDFYLGWLKISKSSARVKVHKWILPYKGAEEFMLKAQAKHRLRYPFLHLILSYLLCMSLHEHLLR